MIVKFCYHISNKRISRFLSFVQIQNCEKAAVAAKSAETATLAAAPKSEAHPIDMLKPS